MSDVIELKKVLKRWETVFYRKYNKKPSKNDIDTAPQEIRDAYKNYANLKKGNSVSSAPKDAVDNCNVNNRNVSESEKTISNGSQECCDWSEGNKNSSNQTNGHDKTANEAGGKDKSDSDSNSKNEETDEVWAASLNKTQHEKNEKQNTKKKSSFSFLDKMGDKLFQNSKKISSSVKKPDPSWQWKSGAEEKNHKGHKSSTGSAGSFEEEPDTPFRDLGNDIDQLGEPMDETDGQMEPLTDKGRNSMFSAVPKFSNSKFFSTPKTPVTKKVPTPSSDSLDIPCNLKLTARKKFSVSSFKPKEMKNPFPEDESNSYTNEGNRTQTRNVMEIDESLFEQEFAENFDEPSFKSSINLMHKKEETVCKSGTRNVPFLQNYGTSEMADPPSATERVKASVKMTKDSCDVFDLGNMSDDSEDEEKVKKKTASRKRKQSSGTASRKRVKVNDGIACPVGGDSVGDGLNDDDDEVVKKVKPKPAARRPTASKASSENFVRLNMKVKKYRRKDGRHLTGPQWKRKQWKQKMQARSKSYGDKCFICNETGHWSRDCPQKNSGSKKVVEDIDENDFPSIQEAAGLARGVKIGSKPMTPSSQTGDAEVTQTKEESADPMLDVEMNIVRSRREQIAPPTCVEPLLRLQPNGELQDTASVPDIKMGLKKYGFKQFRQGQEETVKRILTGLSTLVVLSTGGGKSLCYQLPAYIYAQHSKCITIVVSPLVSLMEDQVTGLPAGVRGACLHANMTKAQRDGVLAAVNDGSVHFLLVSPEAVVGGGGGLQGSFPAPDKLPPIPFVCIDEAHCLSEWSHNFRPSYLRLCKVLRERYGVKCFLGLTATATKSTAMDVARHLGIEDAEKATIRGSPVPRNLVLSVSQDENRDEALVELLKGERFRSCHSIIIYCTRRELTNRVSTLLRTCMQEEVDLRLPGEEPKGKGKKKKVAVAESYHAGLTPAQRKRVQKNFMSGVLRIVVATVAFGMGLDKADVRAVIHYNMPKSFEGYVQEIGRAGRDGKPSHCHLFLDPEGKDLSELKRHTYGNTVDRFALKKLMSQVFKKCRCREIHQSRQNTETEDVPGPSQRICPGHERALPIDKTVMELDIREEGIATLLCYLELLPECWLENLQPAYAFCKVICYGGPPQLQAVAKKCPPVGVAIAKQKMEGKSFSQANSLEFPIVEISDTMGWDSGPVKREVKLLQWNMSAQGGQFTSKSGVLVEFSDLAFHLRSPGDLTVSELDDIVDFLHRRVTRQEETELYQLNLLYNSLRSAAHKSYWMCADEANMKKSDRLRQLMENFFHEEKSAQDRMEEETDMEDADINQIPTGRDLDQLIVDIRQFINMYGEEHSLNGRAIARIFHGIGSPCFPIATWCRVRRFWRSHLHVNFNVVLKTATRELVRMR